MRSDLVDQEQYHIGALPCGLDSMPYDIDGVGGGHSCPVLRLVSNTSMMP